MEINEIQRKYIENKLKILEQSKFRSSFHLKKELKEYVTKKGMSQIERHCHDFIIQKLAPYPTIKDGKQTPMKGHPVFIAQHATATCCRGCLKKWYKIPKDRPLQDREIKFIEAIIIEWINKEMAK